MEEDMKMGELKESEKKTKNLISIIILLAGLFIGSLFIDAAQFFKKNGFSDKKLSQSDIFEANGKTWVAYSEPAAAMQVIIDDSCEKCNVDEILVWMRRILPTVAAEKVDYNSDRGKDLIDKFGIKSLPAFVFANEVSQTDFYKQAEVLFDKKDSQFFLRTQDVGIPVGKYIALPAINDNDAISGPKDANVKVVVFSDFQCPYCKIFHKALGDAMKNYGDKVLFDYKYLPLAEIHPQANNAALAAACALEQEKFWEYADKLYGNQTGWANTDNIAKFKEYAKSLSLDSVRFNECLDSKKYQDKIDADKKEADSFSISGTPGVFVNDQLQESAISYEQLKNAIEGELGK
ncbi:MAG TPA: hypothetical protein DCS28_00940 [Candidatus Moranbacteria bacterium]|nr:hypothetical protein [Candidatus Moranbacteria bacterium]HAT74594.1 hypothetical protein [Candidatus Moranbacteria bacterium]